MRSLQPLPPLSDVTLERLNSNTDLILEKSDPDERKEIAKRLYNRARSENWFSLVVDNLRSICGNGELCMFCSSNEPSQIEHYRPMSVFPEKAMSYDNYTWSCDICNRTKGSRFPPDTEPGDTILNPLLDNVWDYYFLDDMFGRLMKRSDTSGEFLSRSVSTCNVVRIDRENVQIKRQARYNAIKREISNALHNYNKHMIDREQLRNVLDNIMIEPFQADVADFFLNGPGRDTEPFKTAIDIAKNDGL